MRYGPEKSIGAIWRSRAIPCDLMRLLALSGNLRTRLRTDRLAIWRSRAIPCDLVRYVTVTVLYPLCRSPLEPSCVKPLTSTRTVHPRYSMTMSHSWAAWPARNVYSVQLQSREDRLFSHLNFSGTVYFRLPTPPSPCPSLQHHRSRSG